MTKKLFREKHPRRYTAFILLAIGCCLLILAGLYFRKQLKQHVQAENSPRIVIAGAGSTGAFDISADALQAAAATVVSKVSYADALRDADVTAEDSLNPAAAIVRLADAGDAADLLSFAGSRNLPVIFCGEKPSSETMQSYDKCWYIGGSAEKRGEMLGEALFSLYSAGKLTDLNGDGLIQYIVFTRNADDQTSAAAAMRIFDDRGVYGAQLSVIPIEETTDAEIKNAISAELVFHAGAEVLFAPDPSVAVLCVRAAAETAPGTPVACFGYDAGTLDSLLADGSLLACCAYRQQAAAALAAAFARNAALGLPVTEGTDARLDADRCTVVGCEARTQAGIFSAS